MKVDFTEVKNRFAELKKRWQARTVFAMTIESGRVIVDLMDANHGEPRAVQSFTLPFGAEEVIANPEKAGQELAAQLAVAAVRERRCVVCIPPSWALTTATDVPEVTGEDLRGYLELRAEREFPAAVADLRLAHCSYTLPEGKARATLVAVPAKRMQAVERMLEIAGCRALSISLGLDACLPERDLPGAVHFLANGSHVDVVVSAGGGIAAVRSLPGVAHPADANFDAAGFSREVRITLGGLPEGVRQQVKEARFRGTPESAENLCIEIRQHLQRMGLKSRLQRDEAGAEHPPGQAAAAHHFRQEPVIFEFVPPQVNRWQTLLARFDSKRQRSAIVGAVALVLLPVLVFFVRSRIESSLASEWNRMQRNVAELESLQQRIRQFRPWFEPAPQALQLVEGIVGAFPESGEVWAKRIDLSETGKVTCEGFSKSQSALTSLLDRLRSRPGIVGLQRQQERGENPIQFSFTFQWEAHDAK